MSSSKMTYSDYLTKTYGQKAATTGADAPAANTVPANGAGTPAAAAPTGYADYLTGLAASNTAAPVATKPAAGTAAPGGYASYLQNLAKASGTAGQTPAASAPAAAPSGYAAWLETQARNHKIENTPTNAMSYADYLLYMGSDPAGNYRASEQAANRALAAATRKNGLQGQSLARSGLVASGYGEYLTSRAYADHAAALQAAQQAAQNEMQASRQSYGAYLLSLKTENETKAMEGITAQGLTGDAAKAYARSLGVTEDRLDYIVSESVPSVAAARTAAQQAQGQQIAAALSDVSALMEGGNTLDAAIATLNGVYDADTLEKVKSNYQAGNAQQYATAINSATGVSNHKATLDQALALGKIDQAGYDEQLQAGYAKNWSFVQKAIDSSDFSGLVQYAADNGLTAPTDVDTTDAVIDHMAQSGAITGEQRQQYYAAVEKKTIIDSELTSKAAVNEVSVIQDRVNNGQITEEQKKELMETLGKKVRQTLGGVELKGIKWGTNEGYSPRTEFYCTVYYNQGNNRGEAIDISWGRAESLAEKGEFYAFPGYEKNGMSIGVVGGQLAARLPDGTIYKAFYTNTFDNAGFVAWALTEAYQQK